MRRLPTASIASFLVAIAFLPLRAAAQTCTPPPSGLLAWYRMEGSANDELGTNDPSATFDVGFVCGEVGQGATLAADGFIDVPDSPSLELQQITLDAWARPDGPGPTPNGSVIITKNTNANDLSIQLSWTEQSGGRFQLAFFDSGNTVLQSADPFPPGTFHHVAGTYDGATFLLYVDGVLEGSFPLATTIAYNSSVPWAIGANNAPARGVGFPRTWNGVIDEVEIIDHALSASEVAALFAAGSAGKCPSPPICTTTTTTSTTTTTTTTTSTTTTSTTLPAACAPTPATGCHVAAPLKSTVTIVDNADPTKQLFKWKWKAAATDATAVGEFRDPVSATPTVRACVYDVSVNPQPLMQAQVPAGGTCAGKPCWKPVGSVAAPRGGKYKNVAATPDGLTNATLLGGAAGKAKIGLKGKGSLLQNPDNLHLIFPVTVQLLIGDGNGTSCWQTTYAAGAETATKFSAKGP
jgi:hypothetical protein